jgi:hypothetical protein
VALTLRQSLLQAGEELAPWKAQSPWEALRRENEHEWQIWARGDFYKMDDVLEKDNHQQDLFPFSLKYLFEKQQMHTCLGMGETAESIC